ncbi:GMC family oxidoreductase [Streptomyces sp. NPDC002143]
MDYHHRAREAEIGAIGQALGVPFDDAPPTLLSVGSSLHYQGTTRTGPADDGTSVCDSHSRVWGLSGLWVADNSVIPTATACNPTLTSVALAVRSTHALIATLAERLGPPVCSNAT